MGSVIIAPDVGSGGGGGAVSNDPTLGGATPSETVAPSQEAVQEFVAANGGGTPEATLKVSFTGTLPEVFFAADVELEAQPATSVTMGAADGASPITKGGPAFLKKATFSTMPNGADVETLIFDDLHVMDMDHPEPYFTGMASLQSLRFPQLKKSQTAFAVLSLDNLDELDVASLEQVDFLFFTGLASLATINFENLRSASGFTVNSMPALQSLAIPALSSCSSMSILGCDSLLIVGAPELTTVSSAMSIGFSTSVEQCLFPVLDNCASMQIYEMGSLVVLDLSSLRTVGAFQVYTHPLLVDIVLSSLEVVSGGWNFTNMESLASVAIPVLKSVSGNITFTGTALTSASVESILVKLASLDGTAGTTSWDNQTVDLSGGTSSGLAALTAPAIAAKATLEARGNTVTLNA